MNRNALLVRHILHFSSHIRLADGQALSVNDLDVMLLLYYLWHKKLRLSIGQLKELVCAKHHATIGKTVRRLEEAGWTTRSHDKADARVVLLAATPLLIQAVEELFVNAEYQTTVTLQRKLA